MNSIKKFTNAINYRLLACILVVTAGVSLMSGVAFAQITDTVDVTVTVGAGQSSLNLTETSVAFGSVIPSQQTGSRFESGNVTGDYFAANGPWEIRAYTTDANNREGLIGTGVTAPTNNQGSRIRLKVDPGADADVTNDNDWVGVAPNSPEFLTVRDDSAQTPAIIASSANGDPGNNTSLVFNFGIDAAGAAQGPYEATVTVDLSIL